MTTKAKKEPHTSRLTRELLETAGDLRKSGLISKGAHDKITMRHLGGASALSPATASISGPDIRAIRERANLSQAVFARYLNVTPGYISQLERGDKTPTGPALVLLDVIRRRGLDAIL